MKKEYNFAKAEQGKFYRPVEELEVPIYLEKEIEKFFSEKASDRNITLDKVKYVFFEGSHQLYVIIH